MVTAHQIQLVVATIIIFAAVSNDLQSVLFFAVMLIVALLFFMWLWRYLGWLPEEEEEDAIQGQQFVPANGCMHRRRDGNRRVRHNH